MKPSTPIRNCLHLVMQSSIEALNNCHTQLGDGDAVLFLDDGVMAVANDNWESLRCQKPGERNISISFSAVDLEARGLSGLAQAAGFAMLTDAKIAGLLQTYDFCLTWK